MKDTILCLCDLTGVMAKPWVEAGYKTVLVDPQHSGITTHGQITKIGHVIDHPETWQYLRSIKDRVAFVAAFPPCTDLAVSGARWFTDKASKDKAFQFKAMQVVWQCHVIAEMMDAPYFIENPVSQISTYWRKPDCFFHPYQYTGFCAEDNYTKKTCLWTGGGFTLPAPNQINLGKPDDRIHKCPPSADRGNIRSATPEGFAIAVFNHMTAQEQAA